MTENLGRKITIILVLVLASLAGLFIPDKPLRLGLDLQGGTRLQYRFDFDAALAAGKISQHEYADRGQMLQDFCNIIRGRVDPQGVMELSIRPEGTDRITIELPGAAELSTAKTIATLAQPLEAGATSMSLDGNATELIKAFPLSGGLIKIARERIAYGSRAGPLLNDLKRGTDSTTDERHDAGATIELLSNDDLQKRIENVGDLQFLIAAKDTDLQGLGTDLTKEREKVGAWITAHPGQSLDVFNRLPVDQGGPAPGTRWHPHRVAKGALESPIQERLQPLVVPQPQWIFSGDDLETVGYSSDELGYPAVSFEMSPEKKSAFGDFTESHINDGMAIVLNGEIATLATIRSKLPGGGQISGGGNGFTQKEVKDLITVLRSGSLRIKPDLLAKERVGASLGDDYIMTSLYSAIVALLGIAVFMIFLYRRLGVLSVIGLVINLLLLMGSLAFLKATLTLPGVAGVILTLGMAVDSNILIYERLREEMQHGLKLIQAHKKAFDRAAVTIIDSHVTQLIAGVILYYVGTGPIRGFATTLNIGILTTLFTVLVVTDVLVYLDIKRGASTFNMMKMFKVPNYDFMGVAKYAIGLSVVVIGIGCFLFIRLPDREKLGIDFLGGFTMTVQTQEAQPVSRIRELIKQLPGTIGQSAEVKAKLESGTTDKGFTAFRITYKLSGEATAVDENARGETGEKEIREVLASVLQKGPIEVTLTPADPAGPANNGTQVAGDIYFDAPHPSTEIEPLLAALGIVDAHIEPVPNRPEFMHFSGRIEGTSPHAEDLAHSIQSKIEVLKDSKGKVFSLRSPVPETALVGAQAGGELRDKAVLAVLLSLVGTILYLRIRFADYSYGIAVVVSLLHDVLIALGALAVATMTGWVQAELDLAMVAAFLTIIGYSQNDTIVIFDRVRENLTKSKGELRDVLNDSINQTLARTLLTTATVILTLVVLFAFNVGSRNVLEGFAFAMLVGVISGAYSTVYVASPVLLWCEKFAAARAAKAAA